MTPDHVPAVEARMQEIMELRRRLIRATPAARAAAPRCVTRGRGRRWRLLGPAVTPAADRAAAAGVEARPALVSVTPALFGRGLDLGHVEVVFRPLDSDLLLD